MGYLGLVLLIVLLIPIFAILSDSPLGRAAARRLEGNRVPPEVGDLARRVDLLESELEDLTRKHELLQEEHQFFQRLLEEGGQRRPPSTPGT